MEPGYNLHIRTEKPACITACYPVFEWLNQESYTNTFLGLNSNLYCSVIPIITSSSDLRRWPKVKMYTKTKHNLHNTRDKVFSHICCRVVITLSIKVEKKIQFRGVSDFEPALASKFDEEYSRLTLNYILEIHCPMRVHYIRIYFLYLVKDIIWNK